MAAGAGGLDAERIYCWRWFDRNNSLDAVRGAGTVKASTTERIDMGLDMYLSAKRYLWNEERETVTVSGFDIPAPLELCEVRCRAAYWRKANMIHAWFVANVQDDDDNCAPYEVGRDDLQTLIDLCREVLVNRDKAAELLPTQHGFFFGGYEYDDDYFDELQRTADELATLLETVNDSWSFEYQASW